MNFLDIAKTRYSVRSYKDKRVEKEKLEQILEAAHVAPTAANLQPVRLLVVQEKEGLDKISEAANIYSAPLAIIVCSDHSIAWKRPFDNKQTTELGLGTVWVCYFKPDIIKKEFELPDTLEPVNILLIGYSDEEPMPLNRHSKTRITLSQLVSYEML